MSLRPGPPRSEAVKRALNGRAGGRAGVSAAHSAQGNSGYIYPWPLKRGSD